MKKVKPLLVATLDEHAEIRKLRFQIRLLEKKLVAAEAKAEVLAMELAVARENLADEEWEGAIAQGELGG